jgi:gliding motility-associated-like protein
VFPNVNTSYMLIACNGLCCDTDTVAVTVASLPVCDAGPDVTILVGSCTTLNATGGVSYAWTPGGSLSDSTIANPLACPSVTTTYYVVVTNGSGCTCVDSVTVTVLPQIIIPNGISPNGDGQNDYWIIDNIGIFPDNVVEVYNRWGELLFQGQGYDNVNVKWDGRYKGKDLPVGSYYYIIDLHSDLYPEDFTGPITILR